MVTWKSGKFPNPVYGVCCDRGCQQAAVGGVIMMVAEVMIAALRFRACAHAEGSYVWPDGWSNRQENDRM